MLSTSQPTPWERLDYSSYQWQRNLVKLRAYRCSNASIITSHLPKFLAYGHCSTFPYIMSSGTSANPLGGVAPEVLDMTISEEKHDAGISSSRDESIAAEKGEFYSIREEAQRTNSDGEPIVKLSHEEQFPIDPDTPEHEPQLTVRAILVGCILGGVIAASK